MVELSPVKRTKRCRCFHPVLQRGAHSAEVISGEIERHVGVNRGEAGKGIHIIRFAMAKKVNLNFRVCDFVVTKKAGGALSPLAEGVAASGHLRVDGPGGDV